VFLPKPFWVSLFSLLHQILNNLKKKEEIYYPFSPEEKRKRGKKEIQIEGIDDEKVTTYISK